MVPDKTGALLSTDRRSFQYSKIVLGEHEVVPVNNHSCYYYVTVL